MAETPAVESKATGRRHFILLRDLTDGHQEWHAGCLWSDTDRMVNGHELQLRCPVSGEDDAEGSLRVVCSDVSELTTEMLALLVAVREPQQRLMLFSDAAWFREGVELHAGDPVRVTQNGRRLAGVLRYKGATPRSPGTHFGVELLPRFAREGTTDGVFQRKRFFICDEDCAVFVSLSKIRLRRGDGDDDAIGDTPALQLQLSDRVVYRSDDNGPCMATVRWFGYLPEARSYELIAGVEFDNPIGKGTGKFRGRHIFHTRKHHASLIPMSELNREDEVSLPRDNVVTDRQPDTASIHVGQEPSVPDCQLTVGSHVQVLRDPVRRGVIRWIGDLQEGGRRIAGLEMVDEDPSCYTRGTFAGRQIFPCSEQRAFFVSLQKCRPASTTVAHSLKQSPRLETVIDAFCGDHRGIHGSANSCHMDVVLFVMFAFRGPFDESLEQQSAEDEESAPNDHGACSKLKCLVDLLRIEYYVDNDTATQLHETLNTLRPSVCLDRQGRDPSTFLSFVCREVLKAAPFVTLNTGQDEYVYQIVSCVEPDTTDPPTVQLLLEESLRQSGSKLCGIPTTLILQTRGDAGGCTRVLPTLHLDITDLLAGHDRCCHRCGHAAQVECSQCCEELSGGDMRQMTFCESCFAEHHGSGDMHHGQRITVDIATPENRTILELFAIITTEGETCASFVKPPGEVQLPWLQFECVSCREDHEAEPSVPVVRRCQDFDKWLSEEHRQSLVSQTADVPSEICRVLSSVSLWFYRKMECE